MKNPDGHGFFNGVFRPLRRAASLRGWSAPKALPLESAAFEKAGEAFWKTAKLFSYSAAAAFAADWAVSAYFFTSVCAITRGVSPGFSRRDT